MKKILIAVAAAVMLVACGGPKSPVDSLLDLLGKGIVAAATNNVEKGEQLNAEAQAIIEANSDYVLTDSDKDKIVRRFKGFFDDAFKIASKNGDIPEMFLDGIKDELKSELDKLRESLEDVTTLGDMRELVLDEGLDNLDDLDFDENAH